MVSSDNVMRTSIGRRLDPKYPTNLAVLILAPVAGILAGLIALRQGLPVLESLEKGLRGALVTFAAWALARELDPDDNAAAFVSLALGYIAFLGLPKASILLVFTTLMLARIVNRIVGVPARATDSIFVTILVGWTVYSTGSTAPGFLAALAFALDALLSRPLRRQWIFAAICLVGAGAVLWQRPFAAVDSSPPFRTHLLLLTAIVIIYVVAILSTKRVRSKADATDSELDLSRVRAGMLVALLAAVQGILPGVAGLVQSSIVWAVIAGVALTSLVNLILQRGVQREA